MKTLKKTMYAFLICMTAMVASCSSDDNNNSDDGPSGGGDGTLTATVNGASFESDASFTQIQIINGVLAITGPKAQETIQFNVATYAGAGTYNVSPGTVASYGIVTDPNDPVGSATTYVAISDGVLEISEDTGSNMKGTFSFIGINPLDQSDTVTVTNGSFDISY